MGHLLAKLWPPDAFRDLDLDGLRPALAALPCCGANADGSGKADPLNLVIVGDGLSIVFPLVERGWRFVQPLDLSSAAASAEAFVLDTADPDLPVSPMWLFGRREDLALQKPTSTISQRNHLRLWLTPLRTQGQSVFVGQISRDIGVEFTDKSWYLTTHKIDPTSISTATTCCRICSSPAPSPASASSPASGPRPPWRPGPTSPAIPTSPTACGSW